jgi:hypothetical protein
MQSEEITVAVTSLSMFMMAVGIFTSAEMAGIP